MQNDLKSIVSQMNTVCTPNDRIVSNTGRASQLSRQHQEMLLQSTLNNNDASEIDIGLEFERDQASLKHHIHTQASNHTRTVG